LSDSSRALPHAFHVGHVRALEHIRRMPGGSQPQLMRCSDGGYYVVKFRNNPQGRRVLVNELLGTLLAARMGLPTAPAATVEVTDPLIRLTPDLSIELRDGRPPCAAGLHFGSRYLGTPKDSASSMCIWPHGSVENSPDFVGMLLFDKWTCNTDGRQVVFVRKQERFYRYKAYMIDNGFCFGGEAWKFADAPRRSLYRNARVYEEITGFDSFEPWISRLEHEFNLELLREAAACIPACWLAGDEAEFSQLLQRLNRRRQKIRDELLLMRAASPELFSRWERWCAATA